LEFNSKQDEEPSRTLILSVGKHSKKYRILFSFLVIAIMCTVIAPVISNFVQTPGAFESSLRTRACVDVYYKGNAKAVAVDSSLILVVFALYWRIRKFDDNFLIRKEFANMGKASICVLAYFVVFMIPPMSTFAGNILNLSNLGFVILNLVYVKFSIVDMCKIAQKQKIIAETDFETEPASHVGRDASLRTSDEISPKHEVKRFKALLKHVLSDENLSLQLRDFLVKECSVENYLFLKAVENIRKHPQYSALATKVFQDFCKVDSPLSINISYETRKRLQVNVNLTGDMARDTFRSSEDDLLQAFEAAYKEVFRLILSDSFIRFMAFSKLDLNDNLQDTFDTEAADERAIAMPPTPSTKVAEMQTSIETKVTVAAIA
jgi:hypothetical protein